MSIIHTSNNILICDDSPHHVAYISKVLANKGYKNINTATDPRLVMPLLSADAFDLLLLDVAMPYIDGIELMRQIREKYSETELPILIITGAMDIKTRDLALESGANDYLKKPIDIEEMSLRVRNLLTIRNAHKAHLEAEVNLEKQVIARTVKLDMLIENGLMMSMERDRSKLLRHILVEGQKLLQCDGATMYLVTEKKTLRFAMRTKEDDLPSFEIPLYESTGKPNIKHVSTYVATYNEPVLIDDVYQETRFDLSGTRQFDELSKYHSVSMLTVPMAKVDGEVIGVIQFINALDPVTNKIIPFSSDILKLIRALGAQAAVALDNLQLIDSQKVLTENMIQVIATAIDAKSRYTGSHCSRVPELAMMLAEAANAAVSGPLAVFQFHTADEWREFRIGAWLHDCGKVTTPEYVIDKATKLETIYNRIHEIRMRFEVLLRDAEIERMEALLKGDDSAECQARYAQRKSQLLNDFAFIAECNVGGETISDDHIERLRQIGEIMWVRNFDDRLGISYSETARYQQEEPSCVPVLEKLLVDKLHHLVPRESSDIPDPRFNFNMTVPEYLYNRGELYNLSINRGTLTEEERYKIKEHMVHTISMLDLMHFPKSLRRVPEYASTHHEGLNGLGYPRGLNSDNLSIPSRIMAIADIFEALTAPDRPYKKPNSLSESIKIMYRLKENGHIDPDIFDLFLTSGVFRKYAKKFLTSEQNDDFDFQCYLGPDYERQQNI